MTKRATVSDVAALAGVSSATVSNVLANRTGKVSAKTRQRVLNAIETLNYTYNETAAALRSNKSNIIALVVHDLSNPYYTELISSLNRCLADHGYATILACSDENIVRQQSYLQLMQRHNVLATLLCPAWETTAEHIAAWNALCPTVTFLRSVSAQSIDFIGIDNYQAAYDLTKKLISDGHRDLAFIGGNIHSRSRRQRVQGWKDAHEDAGIYYDEARIIDCASSMSAGSTAAVKLLTDVPQISVVVCYQDVVAFGVINAIHYLGKKPGLDIAVTGFDGLSDAEEWLPSLTTAEVKIKDLTEHIVNRLIERLITPEYPPQLTLLHAHIHWRNSTCTKINAKLA